MRTIVITTQIPDELQVMLSDFRDMANHLLAYALHHRIRSAFALRDAQYDWFREHYGGKYAVHYLHSAASYANGIAQSWRKVGKAKFPHMNRPVAKLDQMLVKVKAVTASGIKLQITIAPRQYVILDLPVKHKRFREYSRHKLGEITIHKDSIDLPFQVPEDKPDSEKMCGIDCNFESVDIATSEGEVRSVSLKRITTIQSNMRKKRESVRKSIPNNLQKQRKVLAKYKKREHNRVKQAVEDLGKTVASVTDGVVIVEDLAKTTGDCLLRGRRGKRGRKFNKRLSGWVHGKLQDATIKNSPYRTKKVNPRGTSSECPFCHGPVIHPIWKESLCSVHGLFDRDKLSAIAILERGRMGLCREPFPANVYASLLEGSVLGDEGAPGSRARLENRYNPMKEDATNVNVVFYELPRR